MEIILRLLGFCTFVSFTNMLGLYPAIEDSKKWVEEAHIIQKIVAIVYVIVISLGYLNLIGYIMYLFLTF